MTAPPAADAALVVGLASFAIAVELDTGTPWLPDPASLPATLREPGACFVTLHRDQELRGCVGGLQPVAPLGVEVARRAADAAFRDPRMTPVQRDELPSLRVHVSVLGPLQTLPASSWAALAAALRPGVDGLVVQVDHRRATLLPTVWGPDVDVETFLAALWAKAGLPHRGWPDGVQVQRYSVRWEAAGACTTP
jgi:AmmeMemoRadiSam system protein A